MYTYIYIYIYIYITLHRRGRRVGKYVFGAPNQRLERSFCCCVAGRRLRHSMIYIMDHTF